jgi:hypothetical protein
MTIGHPKKKKKDSSKLKDKIPPSARMAIGLVMLCLAVFATVLYVKKYRNSRDQDLYMKASDKASSISMVSASDMSTNPVHHV